MVTHPARHGALERAAEALEHARLAMPAGEHPAALVIPAPALLAAMCDMQDFRFLVNGVQTASQAILSDDVMFPAVAWVADRNARELMQADLGYRFGPDPEAPLGLRASGPPVTAHTADLYRALFLMDACTSLFCVAPRASVEVTTVAVQMRELIEAVSLPRGTVQRAVPSLPIPSTPAAAAIAA